MLETNFDAGLVEEVLADVQPRVYCGDRKVADVVGHDEIDLLGVLHGTGWPVWNTVPTQWKAVGVAIDVSRVDYPG